MPARGDAASGEALLQSATAPARGPTAVGDQARARGPRPAAPQPTAAGPDHRPQSPLSRSRFPGMTPLADEALGLAGRRLGPLRGALRHRLRQRRHLRARRPARARESSPSCPRPPPRRWRRRRTPSLRGHAVSPQRLRHDGAASERGRDPAQAGDAHRGELDARTAEVVGDPDAVAARRRTRCRRARRRRRRLRRAPRVTTAFRPVAGQRPARARARC